MDPNTQQLKDEFSILMKINLEEVHKKFQGFSIEFSDDPANKGLDSLNNIISEVENYKEQVVRENQKAIVLEQAYKNFIDRANYLLLEHKNALLVSQEIISLKGAQKMAALDIGIAEERLLVMEAKQEFTKVKAYRKLCDTSLQQLSSIKQAISRQISVIASQIQIGEFAGRVIK